MTERWFSWACRKCLAGWWGPAVPKLCPNCHGDVHITGRGTVTSLKETPDVRTDD